MKLLNQKKQKEIEVEYVFIFFIQAPPEFCFSGLSDEKIRRRAYKDVLIVQMEPETGGCFVISYEKPTGIETVHMKIMDYTPPSVLKIAASPTEGNLTYIYRLKRVPSGTQMTIQMQLCKERNWYNVIIYLLFKRKLERKWNDYWRRLAVEIEKEFYERHLLVRG